MRDLYKLVKNNRERIIKICKKHGAVNVRIFGSVIRGEAGIDSDIDFLVDLETIHSAWFPGGLVADLQDLLGYRVDIVTEKSLHWVIKEMVMNEARPL